MAKKQAKDENTKSNVRSDYLFSMSYAPRIGDDTSVLQMLPIAFFGAFVIMIVKMYSYQRDMTQFYWSSGNSNLTDFFSYYKMAAILICAALAVIMLLYRLCTQSFSIKRCFAYIPMLVYSVMVLISYLLSDYKEFSWLGYNDRFEGTIVLLAYMVMLFFIINTVNSEKSVKWVIYPIAVSSALLGLIGVSQALDHDFFRSSFGQKLITPNGTVQMTEQFLSGKTGSALNEAGLITQEYYTTNELIDMCKSIDIDFLGFTFQHKEIYQTVYNINYVSFYLTLLLPLFGMLFIRSVLRGKDEPIRKKLMWGALFALLVFNLIGSASSGGWLGMGFVVLAALIVLNKKVIKWWKPVAILLAVTIAVGGITYDRWIGELTGAINGTLGRTAQTAQDAGGNDGSGSEGGENGAAVDGEGSAVPAAAAHKLQYIDTDGNDIIIGIDDNTLTITTYPENTNAIKILDQDGKSIELVPTDVNPVLAFDDERFENCYLQPARDEEGNDYFIFTSDGQDTNWAFRVTEDGVFYFNNLGHLVDMDRIDSIGWEDNASWGNGRGYIFSRTIPMMKDTMLIGHGADTYCIYFPHKDYVGKYNSGSFSENINIIVDKPHNMYMGAWIGTGGISVIALLTLFFIYLVQSFRLYFKNEFGANDFASFAGAGIFFGIFGFLFAALVDDSTVSVMPMFYTLLGTGISINMIIKRRKTEAE